MKFTIITPVYNSSHLMDRYFYSLENQTFKDFEVVIIDDCSTDNSYDNLLKYKENSKINMIIKKTKSNGGPGAARNMGLSEAKGQYVIFLDSDDYIDLNCLESLKVIIDKYECDCIIFDYYYDYNNGKKVYGSSIPSQKEGIVDSKIALAKSTGSTCCKVYKTDNILINQIQFPPIHRTEDLVFNKLALSICRNIYYLKKPLYFYLKNNASIMHNKNYRTTLYTNKAFDIIENKLKRLYPEETEAIYIKDYLYSAIMILLSNKEDTSEIYSFIQNTTNRYPNWKSNKYIKDFELHQRVVINMIKYKFIFGLRIMSFLQMKLKK